QSDITVSNNHFVNLAAGNNPSLNRQIAFRATSPSSATTTVTYSGNTVAGANVGFAYYPDLNNTGTQPVQFLNNTLTDVFTGFDFASAKSVNFLSGNTITGTGAGIGVDVGNGSTVTVSGTSASNDVSGFATGVKVRSGGTATLSNNASTISGNAVGV